MNNCCQLIGTSFCKLVCYLLSLCFHNALLHDSQIHFWTTHCVPSCFQFIDIKRVKRCRKIDFFNLRFLLFGICDPSAPPPLGLNDCSALSVEAALLDTTVTLAISVTGFGSDWGRFWSFEPSRTMRFLWITVTLSSMDSSSNSYWGRTRIEPVEGEEEDVVWIPLGTPVKGGSPSPISEGTTSLEVKDDDTAIIKVTF